MFLNVNKKMLISKKNEIQTDWNSEQTVVELIEYYQFTTKCF